MTGLATARSVPLVLLEPPVTDEYRNAVYSPAVYRPYREFLNQALEDPGSPLVEADLSAIELTPDDFLDLTHLHPDGAKKVSRHLAANVLLPLLRTDGGF